MFIRSLIYNDNLAIRKTTESVVTDFTKNFVAIDSKDCSAETDSDSVAESETDEEAPQDTYENMYAQWLRVCDENHALVSEIFLFILKINLRRKCWY